LGHYTGHAFLERGDGRFVEAGGGVVLFWEIDDLDVAGVFLIFWVGRCPLIWTNTTVFPHLERLLRPIHIPVLIPVRNRLLLAQTSLRRQLNLRHRQLPLLPILLTNRLPPPLKTRSPPLSTARFIPQARLLMNRK